MPPCQSPQARPGRPSPRARSCGSPRPSAPGGPPRRLHGLAGRRGRARASTYDELWRWSVTHLEEFWSSLWRVSSTLGPRPVAQTCSCRGTGAEGARWFLGQRINYVDRVLRQPPRGSRAHRRGRDGRGGPPHLRRAPRPRWPGRSRRDCAPSGSAPATGWRRSCRTVRLRWPPSSGRRASGAVWSTCAPSSGADSMVDRFAQIEPSVLLVADGYQYGGRSVRPLGRHGRALRRQLPDCASLVSVPRRPARRRSARVARWAELTGDAAAAEPVQPSPSTTRCGSCTRRAPPGLPKAIVHGHGGHPARAPEGARSCTATSGRADRLLLVHDDRLDDVELPRRRPPGRGDHRAASTATRCSPTSGGLWRLAERDRDDATSARAHRSSMACRKAGIGRPETPISAASARHRVDGRAALARGLRLGLRAGRSATCSSAPSAGGTDVCTAFIGVVPAPAGARRRDPVPARSAPRWRPSTRRAPRRRRGGRARRHRADALDAGRASGATRTATRLHESYFAAYPGVGATGTG